MNSTSFGDGETTADDLPGLLAAWARRCPDDPAVSHLDYRVNPRGVLTKWSWRELDERVDAVASWLGGRVRPGGTVAVLIGQTPDYHAAFLGALRAGMVAVPLFPPGLPGHGERLASVLRDCGAKTVLTIQDTAVEVEDFLRTHGLPVDQIVSVDKLPATFGAGFAPIPPAQDAIAYLQYTSGSTGDPRGVMITHANVVANARQACAAYGVRQDSVSVSWLPLFHDMGLVLSIAAPLTSGMRAVLMDPLAFLEKPERWLQALSANPGAITAAPSFAYGYCAARVSDWEKARLRLDTVLALIDGSEPVQAGVIDRFYAAFAECGLKPDVYSPSFGLAEATVFVSAGRGGLIRRLDRAELAAGHAVAASANHPDSIRLVSCGQSIGQRVFVVDPDTGIPRPAGEVGEIWVAGPNVGQGYWGRPEESRRTFGNTVPGYEGSWLATGDLGVWCDGELFVTGRIKDLIVVDGRNHYPQDVERTAESAHGAIRPRNVVAFSVAGSDGESAVVLAERAKAVNGVDPDEVAAAVRAAVARAHGLALREVRLVEPEELPRTTSGKISRSACRTRYLADILTEAV
ncbi:Acyl-CoA synthetase (AMP-forming)/AMP-acid ligase II [Actinokineospora alba]|uniref:Acyl-CoA synthetase (AMP-forming)/AMP-acid ligase II n=1 Tax=Actinokineospora alba TaxID=504798 RepID=A0A1H0W940_9PSEU|nr:fatty acyl-AMP ligase [Actinokineospora alba]TDP69981.1 acyl-CoA synthetase (AMP-forming)/AMP-acid ligase II [Actinokineospora alba]SDJ50601.1 Acyl-CoA synthetase (AMP-forming)/AMP-acid ligase II [Actinokineospora alba]SDP86806.1 Acyl-CoA synthetase (AMP-forming)/AMP-acid ligase II [Actinokineospora alba]